MPIEDLRAGAVNLAVYTSPHATADLDPLPAVVALIKSAKKTIHFSAYSFTSAAIADGLIEAHGRGVDITAIADASQYGGLTSQWPKVLAAGITNIKVWGGEYNLNHEKVLVIDSQDVALGSYNFTTSAEKSNKEVLVVITGIQSGRILAPALIAQIEDTYSKGHSPL